MSTFMVERFVLVTDHKPLVGHKKAMPLQAAVQL